MASSSTSRPGDLSPPIPIEPGHTLGTGLQLIASAEAEGSAGAREKEDGHGVDHGDGQETEGKSLLVFKRLRRDIPLPGRHVLWAMLAALFLSMFLAGWNDASQGPLLPSLQAYYSVNYTIISTIWISSFVGFFLSGVANVPLSDRFGFGIVCPLGAASQGLAYALMCWGGPFPLFVVAYLFVGFGLGLQDAQVNSLTSRLDNAQTKMFLMHAVYGFGATVSPLISTEFVKTVSGRVYLYFAVSLGLALATASFLVVVFKGRTEDQVVGKREVEVEVVDMAITPEERERKRAKKEKARGDGGSGSKMRRIMKTPAVHFLAVYILVYVGVEVTIGGWATSFILDERGGNDNAGYITTGYFGGLTLGRVLLIPVTNYLGNSNSIYIYSVIAIVLELIIWFTRSIPGNAVCFALIGFVLGPMYPIVMMTVLEVVPGELQSGSIGWIASLGQGGSAIMPFITGAIANSHGVWILQPLIIAFIVFSLVLWAPISLPKWQLGNGRLKEHPSIESSTGSASAGETGLEPSSEKGRLG